MHCSVTFPLFSYNYSATFLDFALFDLFNFFSKPCSKRIIFSFFEVTCKFREFSSSLIIDAYTYMDGFKKDENSAVGRFLIRSIKHKLAIKHKLPSDTSIFSAEAWAIYQALILAESAGHRRVAIFSDSKKCFGSSFFFFNQTLLQLFDPSN